MSEFEKMDGHSADIFGTNVAALQGLFPEAFTEAKGVDGATTHKIDFEVLRQLLGDRVVVEGEGKYGLSWHGKDRARQLALTPSAATLRPAPEESVDWDTTQNIMIEGDNLEVLKLLQKSYAGRVKLIYIDPPYNTGKDFVYPDDFRDTIGNYLNLTGQSGDGGGKLTSNPETSGRFHTDWLNMMYPRLKLARDLLRDDGVIAISIDDRELSNLRFVMNEVFGAERFIASMAVVNNLKGRNDKKYISSCHELLVLYSGPNFVSRGLELTDEQRAAFKYTDDNGEKYGLRDLRKRGGPDLREDRPKMYFPIYWNPTTETASLKRQDDSDVEIHPHRSDKAEGRWRWGNEKVGRYIDWVHARQSRAGSWKVEHRVYLNPKLEPEQFDEELEDLGNEIDDLSEGEEDEASLERTSKPKSFLLGGEFSTDTGQRLVKQLGLGGAFDFPKPVDLLRTLVQLTTSTTEIVLDFFAGSGTTAHAVFAHNDHDNEPRRFILVQLPELLDPSKKSQKKAAKLCDSLNKPRTIAELTKERLRRAGAHIKAENPLFTGDTGFRVFKLDRSNIRAWDPDTKDIAADLLEHVDHLIPGRTDQDVLYEVLLKQGLDLCVPMQEQMYSGHKVWCIGGGVLFVCLSNNIDRPAAEAIADGIAGWHKALAPATDTRLIFKDSGFKDDVAKTNLTAILAQHGLKDVRSI